MLYILTNLYLCPIYPHYFELRYREFQQRVWINMETWIFLFYILSLVGHVKIIYHFVLSIKMYNRMKIFFYLIYQNQKSIKFQKWICSKQNQFFLKSKLISIIRHKFFLGFSILYFVTKPKYGIAKSILYILRKMPFKFTDKLLSFLNIHTHPTFTNLGINKLNVFLKRIVVYILPNCFYLQLKHTSNKKFYYQ